MVLLFLMPGFFYIVYQNWGNDPQWLMLVGMLALILRARKRGGKRLGHAICATPCASPASWRWPLARLRSSTCSTALSARRRERDQMVRLLPRLDGQDDIFTFEPRLYKADLRLADDGGGPGFRCVPQGRTAQGRHQAERRSAAGMRTGNRGERLDRSRGRRPDRCRLRRQGDLGTDLFSLYWAFGDFKPVKGAAPWYYGGLSGVENADYLVVPMCPGQAMIRDEMLKNLRTAAGH